MAFYIKKRTIYSPFCRFFINKFICSKQQSYKLSELKGVNSDMLKT